MKQVYILCDTKGLIDDIILSDERKARRIVHSTNGRVIIRNAYTMNETLDLALYEQHLNSLGTKTVGNPHETTRA